MPKTISELQADVQRFKAMKQGGAAPMATTTQTAPAARPTVSSTGRDFAALDEKLKNRQSGDVGVGAPDTEIPQEPGALASFARGLFSAPATIVARPFQAVAAVAGASNDQIDEFTNKIPVLGGLIEDAPDTYKDVKKDVGRAAQTVALGTGAPIAGGALFGAGASLEQGNDLFSAQTAIDAALGGAGGKVLDWVGKPLFNAAGKVVGTITPTIIKDVASKGAAGVQEFARTHKLLGGVMAAPSEALAKGMQGVDDAIVGGFKKGGSAVQKIAAEQFPGMNPVEHFRKVNERDLVLPTTINKPAYRKATAIYKDAQGRGINLEETLTKRRIQHDDLHEGGAYNTADTADAIRQSNYKDATEVLRPALKEIEPGVQLVPISRVREVMIDRVNAQPATKLKPKEKEAMIRQIEKDYADVSANARANPNGYSLTALHDGRIVSMANGKFTPGISTAPSVLKAKLSRLEGTGFKDIFDATLPKNTGIEGVRREFEENFLLADYLDALNMKKVPEGVVKKAVRLFGRAAAATVGGKIGGFPGAILGSQYGDMLFASFEALPNPLKKAVLNRLKAEKSPAFEVLDKFMKASKAEREAMLALPAAGESSLGPSSPTLFTTPGGVSTPNKGEAFDLTAVEQGRARVPKTDRRLKSYLTKVQTAQENQGPYIPERQMPVIKAGAKPKKARSLTDIYID